jgi:SAM-dependent methyltransferase
VGRSDRYRPGSTKLPGGSRQLFYSEKDIANLQERVDEVLQFADLRPTDHVLDAGCAEGLITLELAQHVERIHGFDLSKLRIRTARRYAEERGIQNATFQVDSVIGYPVEPLSYDVTLFFGVWGSEGVGFAELDNLLKATRRQLFARIQLNGNRSRVAPLYEVCDRNDFDVLCFPGKIVIALRRGTDARVPLLPAVALVPTTMLADHPVVRRGDAFEDLPFEEENSSPPPSGEAPSV